MFQRFITRAGEDVFTHTAFCTHSGVKQQDYIVPQGWNAAAVDVLVEHCFYEGLVPAKTRPIKEDGVPAWLWRQESDSQDIAYEKDFRAVLHRMAGAWTYHAWHENIFNGDEQSARGFYDDVRAALIQRMFSPELSLWQAGLNWAYGIAEVDFTPAQRSVSFMSETDDRALERAQVLERQYALNNQKTGMMLSVDNIDSLAFIRWKRDAEINVLTQDAGRQTLAYALHQVMDACDRDDVSCGFDPDYNEGLYEAIDAARRAGVGEMAVHTALQYARQGYEDIPLPTARAKTTGDYVIPVVAVHDAFVEAALTDQGVMLYDAGVQSRHYPASILWEALADAIWVSGAPTVFFKDHALNIFDTALQSGTGALLAPGGHNAPSASIDLLSCLSMDGALDVQKLRHLVRLSFMALDGYTAGAYRPVVVSVTSMAAFLMSQGVAYDSDAGRTMAGLVTALVTGTGYEVSAALATAGGVCDGYRKIEKQILNVIRQQCKALSGAAPHNLSRGSVQIQAGLCVDKSLLQAAQNTMSDAYARVREHGLRHGHLTGVQTSPEVQTLLSLHPRDIIPEGDLVRFETQTNLYGRRFNDAVPMGFKKLGYSPAQIDDIYFYVTGHGTLLDAPVVNHASLKEKGFHQAALDALESALGAAQHMRYVFNKWTLGADFCERMLGFTEEEMDGSSFDMLTALGFTEEEIEQANIWCCGAMSLQNAPHLNVAHLSVFNGSNNMPPMAQVKLQAAMDPFLSGCVSHVVALPHESSIDTVQKLLLKGWELGVKNLRIYRDGSSFLSHSLPAARVKDRSQDDFPVLVQVAS